MYWKRSKKIDSEGVIGIPSCATASSCCRRCIIRDRATLWKCSSVITNFSFWWVSDPFPLAVTRFIRTFSHNLNQLHKRLYFVSDIQFTWIICRWHRVSSTGLIVIALIWTSMTINTIFFLLKIRQIYLTWFNTVIWYINCSVKLLQYIYMSKIQIYTHRLIVVYSKALAWLWMFLAVSQPREHGQAAPTKTWEKNA